MKRSTVFMSIVAIASVYFGMLDLYVHEKINIMTVVLITSVVLYSVLLIKEKGIDMFGFARNRNYNEVPEGECSHPLLEPITPPSITSGDDGYTIGVNDDGKTIMKVSCNYSTTTLIMTESGVRQLIRLLEATLPHEETPSESE